MTEVLAPAFVMNAGVFLQLSKSKVFEIGIIREIRNSG